jgi:hypothetical protein
MRDLLRSVCSCSPASLLWTPEVLRRNEGLSVGCAPNGPAKCLWVLGCFSLDLPEVGMPRVALPDSLQLCKISGCLYTPYVQDQRIFGFIIDQLNFSYDIFDNFFIQQVRVSRSHWVSLDTGHC